MLILSNATVWLRNTTLLAPQSSPAQAHSINERVQQLWSTTASGRRYVEIGPLNSSLNKRPASVVVQMESSPRNVEGAQGAQSEASLPIRSGNSLDESTSKLEVEALLAKKGIAAEAKASKLEEEAALPREALNALQSLKVRRETAVFV